MIAVLNSGTGNKKSILNALHLLGADAVLVESPASMAKAKAIVFPGVGSFSAAMKWLRTKQILQPVRQSIMSGKPFFGICLGLQILFERSEESPGVAGFGIFKGDVVKFKHGKVPQIGYNGALAVKDGIVRDGIFYFINSYYPVPRQRDIISAVTEYEGTLFASAVQRDNIFAAQFHPEKSGRDGLALMGRWLKKVSCRRI